MVAVLPLIIDGNKKRQYNPATDTVAGLTNTVLSVNGLVGSVVLTTTQVAEGTNLYFTTTRARAAISATGQLTYNSATGVMNLPVIAFSNPTRAFNTSFQPSTTRNCICTYSVTIQAAATLLFGQRGTVYLRYADDTGFTTNVVEVARTEFGVGSGLVVTGYGGGNITGVIPAGKFVRLVTENNQGTPTFTFRSAQETAL